jgi:hypothetical protein
LKLDGTGLLPLTVISISEDVFVPPLLLTTSVITKRNPVPGGGGESGTH